MGTDLALPVILTAILVAAIAAVVAWERRERRIEQADELILAGCSSEASERVRSIESPRSRARLAGELRWHVRAASEGRTPLGRAEREALAGLADRVEAMADLIEHTPVDPRALVLLWKIVAGPPPAAARGDREAGDELRRRLLRAWDLTRPDDAYVGEMPNAAGMSGADAAFPR